VPKLRPSLKLESVSYEGEARATPIIRRLGLLTYLVLLYSVLSSELP